MKPIFKPAPPSRPDPESKEWCVLGLMVAAAYADGVCPAEEEETMSSLATRTPTLFDLAPETYDAFIKQHEDFLQGRNSVLPLVEHIAQRMPKHPGLPAAVFAQCADIVYADRKITGEEIEFLTEIADQLGLPKAQREPILRIMRIKNEEAMWGAEAHKLPLPPPLKTPHFLARLFGANVPMERLPARAGVLSLILCAAYCDDKVPIEDRTEVDALAMRTHTLHAFSAADVRAFWETFLVEHREHGIARLTARGCDSVPLVPEYRLAVFAQCADIIFADRVVLPVEHAFLKRLAKLLLLRPADREEVLRVIKLKNSH